MYEKIFVLTKGDLILCVGNLSYISKESGLSENRLKSYLNKPKYLDAYSLNSLSLGSVDINGF